LIGIEANGMETLISIVNFDDSGEGPEINSPRSLEACLRSGYDPKELMAKKKTFFKGRGITDEMLEIKYEQFEKKRAGKN
jgi:hypothetical protein